jgi:tetratricopeptide (TPR) repeat protein
LKQIARLRLASILYDEKQYDEALRTLDAKHDAPFAGIYSDTRGDILATAGRTEEARKAYQAAITELDAKSQYRGLVQLKLDSLPAAPAVPGAAGGAAMSAPSAGPAAAPGASSAAPVPAPAAAAPSPQKAAPAPSDPPPAPTK